MNARAAIVLGVALAATLAGAAERPIAELKAAATARPADPKARWDLASAYEKAGAKTEAQQAYWAAYLLSNGDDARRAKAREALLRLDKSWKALFDLEKKLGADWRTLAGKAKAKSGLAAGELVALWARKLLVVEEAWRSTHDPLDAFSKLTFVWSEKKLLGKGGVACFDLPAKRHKELAGRTIVVEAIEITITGRTLSKEPELEVVAQLGVGEVKWGKPGEEPATPVWLLARRLGSRDEANQPLRLWLRYYPPKGIGAGVPLVDPRMKGSGQPLKLDKPLAASVRLKSLLPRNRIQITKITLTLYVRVAR